VDPAADAGFTMTKLRRFFVDMLMMGPGTRN